MGSLQELQYWSIQPTARIGGRRRRRRRRRRSHWKTSCDDACHSNYTTCTLL